MLKRWPGHDSNCILNQATPVSTSVRRFEPQLPFQFFVKSQLIKLLTALWQELSSHVKGQNHILHLSTLKNLSLRVSPHCNPAGIAIQMTLLVVLRAAYIKAHHFAVLFHLLTSCKRAQLFHCFSLGVLPVILRDMPFSYLLAFNASFSRFTPFNQHNSCLRSSGW